MIFAGDGFATVADGINVTGNVSNGTDAFGTMTFAGDTTLTGNFGAVANELKVLTLSATSGKTLAITGNAVAADTTSIAGNTVTVGGTFILGAGQNLNATILTPTTNGAIISTGAATVDANATLTLTVDPASGYISTGDSWTIIDGGAGAGVATLAAGIPNTAVLSFAQVANTEDLVVIATRLASAGAATNTSNDDAVGAALDIIGATGGAELDTLQIDIGLAGTSQEVSNLLESVTAVVDGGAQIAVLETGRQMLYINEIRMEALRSKKRMIGNIDVRENGTNRMALRSSNVMTGDADVTKMEALHFNSGKDGAAVDVKRNGVNIWFQGYGQSAKQDTRNGIKGNDSDTLGAVVGMDTMEFMNGAVLGVALNYGRTNVDGKNVNTTETELDNYGIAFYSNVDLGQNMFLNGQLGYAFNQIESDRHDVGGVPGVTAQGDYHSNQFSAKVVVGQDYMADYGMIMTPTVSAAYTYLDTDGYTETGAGALNLNVDNENLNVLALGVGMKTSWNLKNDDGNIVKPSLRVGYSYNALDDKVQTTSAFSGDPASTAFNGNGADLSHSSFNAGAGVVWMTAANWDMSANYDYTYKSDYSAHNGVMRLTSRF